MAFDYSATAASAAEMLERFGQLATLTRVTPGAYDPETGETTPDATDTQEARVLILPYKQGDYLAGMVKLGDRKVLISPDVDWVPDSATRITDVNGQSWQIETLDPLAPAGVTVLYQGNVTR